MEPIGEADVFRQRGLLTIAIFALCFSLGGIQPSEEPSNRSEDDRASTATQASPKAPSSKRPSSALLTTAASTVPPSLSKRNARSSGVPSNGSQSPKGGPAFASASYDDDVLGDGPRWYLKLDETGGTVANDSSANNVDGVIEGGPTLGAAGLAPDGGTALDNPGTGSGVRVTDPTSGFSGLSLEVWFNAEGELSRQGLMIAMNNDSDPFSYQHQLYIQGTDDPGLGFNNSVNFRIRDAWNGGLTTIGSNDSIQSGQTYHVVATTEEGGQSRLYINGAIVASVTGPVDLAGWTASWRVAEGSGGPPYGNFNGRIDNVAVYNYALTPEQVAKHYDAIPAEQLFGFNDWLGWGNLPVNFYADPVNTATGSFTHAEQDVELPGIGMPFRFDRTYNSADATTGSLGRGWTHAFAASLATLPNGDMRLRAGNGQQLLFTRLADGSFVDPSGGRATLVAVAEGYEATRHDQTAYRFDSSGRLVEVRDRSGNAQTLAYNTDGRLSLVTDSADREIDLSYTAAGLLNAIDLPDGRDVTFAYSGGLLASVTDLRNETTLYTYDAGQRLATIVDANGNTKVRNTYGSNGRVVEQFDPMDNRTTFAWNQSLQTSTATDPTGRTWVDVYRGNVLQETREPAGTTSFAWSEDAALTGATDPRGKHYSMTYDASGNLLSRTTPAPLSHEESWTYDVDNNPTSYTDGRGNTTTFTYDSDGRLIEEMRPGSLMREWTHTASGLLETATDAKGETANYSYDSAGNLTVVESRVGARTTYGYDAAGRVVWMVEPRGNVSGADPGDYKTTYTYDAAGNVLSESDPLGNETTYTYDGVGNLLAMTDAAAETTTYSYNAANELVAREIPDGAETTYEYDTRGLLTETTEPEDRITTYSYDAAGRMINMVPPRGNAAGADPDDYRWTYAYDANGNRTSVTDPVGGITTTTYDALNRQVAVEDALNRTTSYAYDANGNQTSVTDAADGETIHTYNALNRLIATTDPRGKTTHYVYDGNGNQIRTTTPLGNETSFAYDADDRLASIVEPRGNISGADPDDYRTVYAYDAAGNRLSERDPLGNMTTFTYDRAGRQVTRKDALNHVTSYSYDALARLTKVTAPDSTETRYTYDSVGNQTTRRDANNHVTTYEYDNAHRLSALTTPAGRVWSYSYDAAGNRIRTVTAIGTASTGDPDDGLIRYSYDQLDRLTGINYSDATPDVDYSYDAVGNRIQMQDGDGTQTTEYDELNRATRIERGADAIAYLYDAAGNITRRTYPGATIDYSYDDDSRLAAVSSSGRTVTYSYDLAGRLARTDFPEANGYRETRAYDAAGRLSEIKTQKGANGQILTRNTYTRDAVGNPLQVVDQAGITTRYEYDVRDQLLRVCYAFACNLTPDRITYTYDPVGNRTSEIRNGTLNPVGTTSYTYNADDELLATSHPLGNTNYTHDLNGNQTTAGARSFTYNLANQLTSTTAAGETSSYRYDGDGNRTRVTDDGEITNALWDPSFALPELVLERDAAGSAVRRFTHGHDTLWMNAGTNTFYYHPDGIGSIASVTGQSGVQQFAYTYEPYGNTRTEIVTNPAGATNPIKFTGEYRDDATGLYNLRARSYDTKTGRFLQVDPVRAEIGGPYSAAFVYVSNQPTVLVDPSGERGQLGGSYCGFLPLQLGTLGGSCWARRPGYDIRELIRSKTELETRPRIGALVSILVGGLALLSGPPATDEDSRRPKLLWRGGEFKARNFRPRSSDATTGLSVWDSPVKALLRSGKTEAQGLNRLKILAAGFWVIKDQSPLMQGHYFISLGYERNVIWANRFETLSVTWTERLMSTWEARSP
ncbi:MAG: DUF6531 domain-containing protein [Actinomycetota bacterium]